MKKFLCLLLSLSLLFLCSCGESRPEEPNAETKPVNAATIPADTGDEIKREITLGYFKGESLNPYKTQSRTNRNLSSLVYGSLFRLDSSYNAVPDVAQSFEQKEGLIKIKLCEDVYFSNGSALGASDVVYSFETAKENGFYKSRLSIFESAYSSGSDVVFVLSRNDIYAVNCLDFPIIPFESASDEMPLGSGRYAFESEDAKLFLQKNSHYSHDEELENERINLLDIGEAENEYNLLQIGDLTFAYDDFSEITHENKVDANIVPVALNNLVYLAFNSESEVLKDKYVKEAVINLIDRSALTLSAYGTDASACMAAFNPSWSVLQGMSADVPEADVVLAEELLEKGGYVFAYSTNEARSKNYEFLSLSFIAPESDSRKVKLAEEIASVLNDTGIGTKLSVLPFEEYKERLEEGDYDLYLGEIKLTNNMSLSPFFSDSGAARFGIDKNSAVRSAYYDFSGGKIDIATFCSVFDECMPFIPICYRNGAAYYSRELQIEGTISETDIFSNIYSWIL